MEEGAEQEKKRSREKMRLRPYSKKRTLPSLSLHIPSSSLTLAAPALCQTAETRGLSSIPGTICERADSPLCSHHYVFIHFNQCFISSLRSSALLAIRGGSRLILGKKRANERERDEEEEEEEEEVLICSDSFTVYQIHPGSWGMTGRRHSAPLTSDLQRYGTRARPGARGLTDSSNRLDTCRMSETGLLSHRDNLHTKMFLSWTSEDREPPHQGQLETIDRSLGLVSSRGAFLEKITGAGLCA
ncbi:unnamed protein product [Pleuronectes platessa]|uniref:Uncharacterized protein n=1 Tax=Pleuronectes platessa TaxID=8262 RepID=A0A9N7ZAI4_PLEPL|nr:unnamed protein product [Pleuronectes platessa]